MRISCRAARWRCCRSSGGCARGRRRASNLQDRLRLRPDEERLARKARMVRSEAMLRGDGPPASERCGHRGLGCAQGKGVGEKASAKASAKPNPDAVVACGGAPSASGAAQPPPRRVVQSRSPAGAAKAKRAAVAASCGGGDVDCSGWRDDDHDDDEQTCSDRARGGERPSAPTASDREHVRLRAGGPRGSAEGRRHMAAASKGADGVALAPSSRFMGHDSGGSHSRWWRHGGERSAAALHPHAGSGRAAMVAPSARASRSFTESRRARRSMAASAEGFSAPTS